MGRFVERWKSMRESEVERLCEHIVGIHWLTTALSIAVWGFFVLYRHFSPEVVSGIFACR
jgi:hypothetical protein